MQLTICIAYLLSACVAAAPTTATVAPVYVPPDAIDDQIVAADAQPGPTDAVTAQETPTDSAVDTAATAASCQGKCGAAYAPAQPCQCTFECAKYKNCCADFASACPNGPSCANRCEQPFSPTAGCQCGWECAKDGLCCADWLPACHSTAQLDYAFASAIAPAGACSQPGDWLPVKSVPDGDTLASAKTRCRRGQRRSPLFAGRHP
ncbi:MAG: hypothetical protein EXR77_02350 [Myxococcales bacterium]|nr:hypothetical protein [Myxococcales bacterium]